MTHSLHREGSLDSLDGDYVLFIYPAKGHNFRGSGPKVRHMAELVHKAGPVNLMAKTRQRKIKGPPDAEGVQEEITIEGTSTFCVYDGKDRIAIETIQHDGSRVYSIFNSPAKLKEALAGIVEADEGISVVISGRIDRVRAIAAEIGIDPHMVNLSLGIHGRRDRLPPADIREFTTMCGHGLVSPNLVRDTIRRVKTGKVSEDKGCEILAAPCVCGIHNPSRSRELLRTQGPLYAVDRW